MEKPYLIQRGSVNDLSNSKIVGLDCLISYDYMGSAEFEFGALSKALKQIIKYFEQLTIVDTKIKSNDGRGLFIICRIIEQPTVLFFIQQLMNNEIRTLERHYLDRINKPNNSDYEKRINFWWDLDNNWMAMLGKSNAKKVLLGIERVRARWINEGKIINEGTF